MSSETATADLKLTPMMQQYRAVKQTLPPNTILFFRLGDFYEMFFEDAVRASEILNLTLTGREAGEAGRVPMCGLPYHAYQGYVKTLLDHQLKVAICEQIGDPKASKGLVERRVTRLISPSTYLDEEQKSSRAEYLVSVACSATMAACACVELSTGDFLIREIPRSRLFEEIALISPRELVVSQSVNRQEGFEDKARELFQVAVTVYDDWIFDPKETVSAVLERYQLKSDRQLEFSDNPLALAAVGACLYFLKDHLQSSLEHLRLPTRVKTSDVMTLDRSAQKSLELSALKNDPRRASSLIGIMDATVTSMGSRTLETWLIQPLTDKVKIEARLDAVQNFITEGAAFQYLRAALQGIRDMERTLSRLNCGLGNARDLVNLKLFLNKIPDLVSTLKRFSSSWTSAVCNQLRAFPELSQFIHRAIVDEPPLAVREGGMIRDGFSPPLDELVAIRKGGREWLSEFEKKEIERTGIKSLKIKYSQVFGYTIDISKSNLHLVPADYHRKQTLSTGERFIVPELRAWDEKISGAEDKIKNLEYQIFNEVRAKVLESLVDLQNTARAVGELDALLSLVYVAQTHRWTRPSILESETLEIEGGRHPVVEAMIPSGEFVANDTLLNHEDHQLIVLTGPNMAGKSTYIRQVALITILAQMGSYVPAKAAQIGIVDRIFTRIGASDDLAKGESTFMVEMLETSQILRSVTSKSLLILDEVGRGTSTFDGVSIAWSICEFLASSAAKPRTLFATHYHELTQLENHFPGIKNYHIRVREAGEGIVFLRKVARGGADRSYGIHVAKLAGIPEDVLRRATEILQVLEKENSIATSILEGAESAKDQPSPRSWQPVLFEVTAPKPTATAHPASEAILNQLKETDLNEMTPMEALQFLDKLKRKIEKSRE